MNEGMVVTCSASFSKQVTIRKSSSSGVGRILLDRCSAKFSIDKMRNGCAVLEIDKSSSILSLIEGGLTSL